MGIFKLRDLLLLVCGYVCEGAWGYVGWYVCSDPFQRLSLYWWSATAALYYNVGLGCERSFPGTWGEGEGGT